MGDGFPGSVERLSRNPQIVSSKGRAVDHDAGFHGLSLDAAPAAAVVP